MGHGNSGETNAVIELVNAGGGHGKGEESERLAEPVNLSPWQIAFPLGKMGVFSRPMLVSSPLVSDAALGFLGEEVELSNVEKALRKLFSGGEEGSDEPIGIARASLINLCLYNESPAELERDAALLTDLTNEVACRALLINADVHSEVIGARAWVQAHCQIDRNGQKTICTEQVSFLLSGRSNSLLCNVVLANLDSDLPLAFWWHGELSDAFDEKLYSRIARLVFDSEGWDSPRNQFLRLLESQRSASTPFVMHDLAYSRINMLRHAIANVFDRPMVTRDLPTLSVVEIGYRQGYRMSALYLAAWIAAKLEAKMDEASTTAELIRCRPGVYGASTGLAIYLKELDPDRRGHLEVKFNFGSLSVEISRCQTRDFLRTLIHRPDVATEEDWLPAPRIDDVSLVADILNRVGRNRTHATILHDVLRMLVL